MIQKINRRPTDFRKIYKQLVAPPFLLRPWEIDRMTLGQVALYFDDGNSNKGQAIGSLAQYIKNRKKN